MTGGFSLELKNVRFAYSDNEKRQDFSLYVEHFSPKGCTALMGENGSGKTTLGKLAAGVLRPDSGCVLYNGADIAKRKLGQIGRCVGYLFQEPSRQLFTAHPLTEIAFALELQGISKSEAEARAMELLRQFELEHIIGHTTYTLSRGEKQRLAIAATMVMEPQFFVLDEPTTGLDKRRRNILVQTLHTLLAKNIGILLISHDREFADALHADIRIMDGGRLVDEKA
ncbi:MAG: energy-coupling factor ABC transporter ATP-binding protein [Oscillospiraceae bacterium]|nr:energy-coupling factor ABC transporter ATP-binding protein [Oscillospiraceae bacterium]